MPEHGSRAPVISLSDVPARGAGDPDLARRQLRADPVDRRSGPLLNSIRSSVEVAADPEQVGQRAAVLAVKNVRSFDVAERSPRNPSGVSPSTLDGGRSVPRNVGVERHRVRVATIALAGVVGGAEERLGRGRHPPSGMT